MCNFSNCNEDLPVKFSYSNRTINGFLTTEGILKLTSKLRDCNSEQLIQLKSGQIIKRKDKHVSLIERQALVFETIDLINNDLSQLNF